MAIEKTISNLIESQFPEFYAEEGPNFIEFVKAYYEWLETTNNVTYHARRLLEYEDVDTTVDGFLIHFKDKYLNDMQFDTAVQTRDLVKHSLDLYRSKGTERSIDLFFKSVFGVPAEVYFPSSDIFKPSSGEWVEPVYLEVDSHVGIKDFIGVQIKGVLSGATAFVDRYIRKKEKDSSRFTDLLYIMNVVGDFTPGEKLMATSSGKIGPTVLGSLDVLSVIDGGELFSIGDVVKLSSSDSGHGGSAIVTGTKGITGNVAFNFIDGGWGYQTNSQVIVSNSIITVVNYAPNTFIQFETVAQPMANLAYSGLTTNAFANGDSVFRSDANGTTIGYGTILSTSQTNSTAGNILVNVVEGSFESEMTLISEDGVTVLEDEDGFDVGLDGFSISDDGYVRNYALVGDDSGVPLYYEDGSFIVGSGALKQASIVSLADVTVSANVMAIGSNVTIMCTNVFTRFNTGEVVYQVDNTSLTSATGTITRASYTGTNGSFTVVGSGGTFLSGSALYSSNSSATGYVSTTTLRLGIFNTTGTFIPGDDSYIFGLSSQSEASLATVSRGNGANFSLTNNFVDYSDVTTGLDYIDDYLVVQLNAADYGFPPGGSENINTVIASALTFVTETYGSPTGIIPLSPGAQYDTAPFVVVYEPDIAKFQKRDYTLNLSSPTGAFIIGELIEQSGNIKAKVMAGSSNNLIFARRLSFNDFNEPETMGFEDGSEMLTEDSFNVYSEQIGDIVGVSSGSHATVLGQDEIKLSLPAGLNANIIALTTTSNGYVTSLKVTDSGFNYFIGETVKFSSLDGTRSGSAAVTALKQGRSLGYHRTNNSLLSADKYLQDNDYYQEFSYEIRAGVTLDRYSDMLKNILHIAGTKAFARFVSQSTIDSSVTLASQEVTIT